MLNNKSNNFGYMILIGAFLTISSYNLKSDFSAKSKPAVSVIKSEIFIKVKAMNEVQPASRLTPLPEGPGLAALYYGDKDISRDPAVIFNENFEGFRGERISSSEMGNWDSRFGDLVITRTAANVHHGTQALQVTHTTTLKAHGAVKEVAGYDTLYIRFYMKFHALFPECHHTDMCIRGGQPGALLDNPTGTRPTGKDHFNAALDHLFPTHGASPKENKHLLDVSIIIAIIWTRRIFMEI
jgi:hypothetical protein